MYHSIASNPLLVPPLSRTLSSVGVKRCATLAAFFLLLGGAASHAANGTWINNSGTDRNYLTVANWANNIVANESPGIATFGSVGGGSVVINGGVRLNGITFAADANAYTFNQLLTHFIQLFPNAVIQTVGAGLHSQTFNNPIAIHGSTTFTSGYSSASHTLNFNGELYGWDHGNKVVTLNGSNTGANTIRGNIRNGLGTTAIAKDGSGTWIVSSTNTYTGTTVVNGGALLVTGTHTGGGDYTVQGGVLGGAGGKISTTGITLSNASGSGLNISGAGLGNIGTQNALTAAGTLELALGSGSFDIRNAGAESLAFVLTTPGTSDQVNITSGTLNIGDGLLSLANFKFDLSNWGPTGAEGTYILFSTASSTGIIGSLAGTGLSETRDGYELTLSLGEGVGGVLDLRLDVTTAIPEPSTVVITLGGLAALAILKRRRNQTA